MRRDVAIIGGGVIGWSIAWHLLNRKASLRVAVLDGMPSLKSSVRGAGGVRAQFASAPNIALSLASIREFQSFSREVGTDVRFRQHGYLMLTADGGRAEQMKELAIIQREQGVRIEEIPISTVAAKVPAVRTDDLAYAQIGLDDGYLDGPAVVAGYRAAAMKLGAEEICCTASSAEGGMVHCDGSDIAALEIVVAAGHWSKLICPSLPVSPEKHQLYEARPAGVNQAWPFVIDVDTTFHFRPADDGILVCYNDAILSGDEFDPTEPPSFDAGVFSRMRDCAESRAPGFLTEENCNSGRAGYYAVTPDRHPMIGRIDGFIAATGFGGHGVMHSPAAGLVVSELILDGEARSVDVSDLSPDRFRNGRALKETMVF